MLAKKPPVPVAADGVTTYAAFAAVVADKPAAFGVKVTLVNDSPDANVPVTVKLVLLAPAVKAVPYVFDGPVAVTVNAAAAMVNAVALELADVQKPSVLAATVAVTV